MPFVNLADDLVAVKDDGEASKKGLEKDDQEEVGTADGVGTRKPLCKKIETLPAPLLAVTNAGSSEDLVVRFNIAMAKGPPRVR